MKVLVCGGRKFDDYAVIFRTLDELRAKDGIDLVIHGNAPGADRLAGRWAHDRGVQEVVCPANWDRKGSHAGPIRNAAMLLLKPDLVVKFPGGSGTEDMVTKAEVAGISVMRVTDQTSP